jgi:hypothetical protein
MLLLSVIVSALLWSLVGGQRADAIGFDSLCITPSKGDSGIQFPSIPAFRFRGDAITGQRHAPSGSFPNSGVLSDAAGLPDWGSRAFTPVHVNAPPTGQAPRPGEDTRPDLEFMLGFRGSTAEDDELGISPLDTLFNENFGIADTPPYPGVNVLGFDLRVRLPDDSWIRDVPDGHYAAELAARVGVPIGGSTTWYEVRFRIDSLQAYARDLDATFPDEVVFAVALRPEWVAGANPFLEPPIAYHWTVANEVVFAGAPADDQPALDLGVEVVETDDNHESPQYFASVVDADLAWDRTPTDFAIGLRQPCNSNPGPGTPAVHFASNLPRPSALGHTLDIGVRSGMSQGMHYADELRLDARVHAVPQRIDVVQRADVVDVLRSTGAAPTIDLETLDIAFDDPDRTDDEPIHAHGRLAGLPPHVRVGLAHDPASSELRTVTVDACPTLDRADPLLERVALVAAAVEATGYVDDCVPVVGDPGATRVLNAHVVVQNFLPDGPQGGTQSGTLPDPPPPAREARDDCLYEAQPDGPWLRRCVHLPEVERKAFVLAGAQHPHHHPWANTNMWLVRAGADLSNFASARFDTEASSRREPGEPVTDDDRAAYGAQDTVAFRLDAGAEPSAQVLTRFDRRDHLQYIDDNHGVLAGAEGTISPLPATIDELSLVTLTRGRDANKSDETPARISWSADDPMTLRADTLEVQLPSRDNNQEPLSGLIIEGGASITLPEQGTLRIDEHLDGDREDTEIRLTSPVPGRREVSIAARITTAADRSAGKALTLSGDATVRTPLEVTLGRHAVRRDLLEVDAVACANRSSCDNDFEIKAIYGPDPGVPTLDAGVPLPEPTPPRPWIVPAPRENNHIAATVGVGGNDWTAHVRTRDFVGVRSRGTSDICVRSASTDPLTAVVQAPDLWADARLSRVPEEVRVRLDRDPAPAAPMVWVDRTSCDTAAPPITATAPEAGPGTSPTDAPIVDARLVLGGGAALSALPMPPPAPPTGDHVRAQVDVAQDGSAAAAATIRVRLPEHLMLWEPTTNCSDLGEIEDFADLIGQIAACSSPAWQPSDRSIVGFRLQSTSYQLGTLHARAHVVSQGGADWTIEADAPAIPGSLHLAARLERVPRLQWNDARIDLVGSIPLEDLHVSATDNSPGRLGFTGDAAGTLRTPVPEVDLTLDHVDDELHVTAHLRQAEVPNAPPAFPHPDAPPACPGWPLTPRGPEGFGYLHADVDLAGNGASATNVVVDAIRALDDPTGVDAQSTLISISTDRAIDATLRARLVNLVQSAGSPRSHFGMCIDFDLPFEVTFTDTKVGRVVNEHSLFALDADTDTPTSSAAMRLGEPGPTGFRPGIPYGFRDIHLDAPPSSWYPPIGANLWRTPDFIFPEQGTTHFPGATGNPQECPEVSGYVPGSSSASTATSPSIGIDGLVNGADGSASTVAMTRTSFFIDVLFDQTERQEMADRDQLEDVLREFQCPGHLVYGGALEGATPALGLPVGRAETTTVQSAEFTIDQLQANGALPSFCSFGGWDSSLANRPDEASGLDFPVAVGADGTRYTIDVSSFSPTEYCRVALVARHPGGAIRWSRVLNTGALPLQYRTAVWHFRIFPDQHDGSVEIQFRQTITSGVYSPFAYAGRLDASGNGHLLYGLGSQTGTVLKQLVGLERRLAVPEIDLATNCIGTAITMPAVAPNNVVRAWYLGDGTVIYSRATTVNHCYERVGDYYALVVDFRNEVPIGHTRRLVHAPG